MEYCGVTYFFFFPCAIWVSTENEGMDSFLSLGEDKEGNSIQPQPLGKLWEGMKLF